MAEQIDPMVEIRRLYAAMVARRPMINRATNYYDGAHNLAFASEKFLEAFGGLFRAFADNWCGVVVDAVEERLNVTGFRVSDAVPAADQDAWRIWQRNELDAQSQLAHQEALYAGAAYAVVWLDGQNRAEITVESGQNTIVACHPKLRHQRHSALRCWLDEEGFEHAELFLPDEVYQFRSPGKRHGTVSDGARVKWIVDPDATDVDSSGRMPNPLGVVPVVELLNRPRLRSSPKAGWAVHSELAAIIPLQDGVNKLIADMLVASEFAAFAQRYATGYELQEDPNTGAAIPPKFAQGAGNVWVAESVDTKFGQFQATDVAGFVSAIDMMIMHVASISRTPPHYLNASADRLSGESIKAAETGLVAKVHRRQQIFGDGWEEVMRLAGKIDNIEALASAESMETIWSDPESRTEAEHVDAVMKKKALGVPQEQLWEDLGYSPQQIQRFRATEARADLFTGAAFPGVPEPVEPVEV